MKKELTNKIINGRVVPYDFLDDYWIIVTNEGIFAPPHGRMFHESREQAWRHWYNEMHWKSHIEYKKDYAKRNGLSLSNYWGVTVDKSNRQIWEDFKESIIEECGFKIIQWKDAKRDVCGEIRA